MSQVLLLGAVAYDPKVSRIWDGFRGWFADHDLPMDYVLYANYERQVDDLVAGRVHLAWNSPLAWIRAARAGRAAGVRVWPLAMRDTDQDLSSVVVVRAGSPFEKPGDLAGGTVATGAVDSPQGTLIPLGYLAELGVEVRPRRFDVGVGLHGDHIGGERDAARALAAGTVDAAVLLDASHLTFANEGTLPPGTTRILAQTPPYDHCNLTATDRAPHALVDRFGELLLGMSYADARLRELFDLEGLTTWRPGRRSGYAALAAAVDRFGFYDDTGRITMPGYHP
jgi:ABC-type phosphate/phosphonate transport system substrate-binding protein